MDMKEQAEKFRKAVLERGGVASVSGRLGGRGRDGPSPPSARAAPRTDPSERSYRTGLPPRVLA